MILDLFAGPGGWSTGLNLLGRREDVGVEWDAAACETARAAGHERRQSDVAELDPVAVAGSDVEGVIGSPPCQGFSMAGSGKGREDSALIIAAVEDMAAGLDPRATLASKVKDDRSVLALEPLRWTLALRPEWVAWEQVPAVFPLWEACARALRSVGYSVEAQMVTAETLGVPQTRKRAILRARRGPLAPLRLTHSRYYARSPEKLDPGTRKWVSMAEALGWGLVERPSYTVTAGGKRMEDGSGGHGSTGAEWGGASVRNALHAARSSGNPDLWRERGWGMTDRPAYTVTGGGTESGGAEPFGHGARDGMERERKAGRWIDREAVAAEVAPRVNNQSGTEFDLAWPADRPAPVIAGREIVTMPGANANRFNGATKSRNDGIRVTVQEAAILQSFPADYPWRGTKTAQYRQVGDAVPPLMAAHVLASVGAGALPASITGETAAAPVDSWTLFDEGEATA